MNVRVATSSSCLYFEISQVSSYKTKHALLFYLPTMSCRAEPRNAPEAEASWWTLYTKVQCKVTKFLRNCKGKRKKMWWNGKIGEQNFPIRLRLLSNKYYSSLQVFVNDNKIWMIWKDLKDFLPKGQLEKKKCLYEAEIPQIDPNRTKSKYRSNLWLRIVRVEAIVFQALTKAVVFAWLWHDLT